jgi:hypothetical protein
VPATTVDLLAALVLERMAAAALLEQLLRGAVGRLERALLASPRFRVIYRNGDATLLRLRR